VYQEKADWKAHKVICKKLNVGDAKKIAHSDHQAHAEKAHLFVIRTIVASLISFSKRKETRITLTLFERCLSFASSTKEPVTLK
jgi:hypothetical protein